jgi:hypothetical protein
MGGVPVGVVEVKKPGPGVLEDERVLGELFDYMKHLPNFYGTREVIGILTTYREWRVCWLDNEETRTLVARSATISDEREEEAVRTPKKPSIDGEPKESSPPGLTPSKKRTNFHEIGEPEQVHDVDDSPHVFDESRTMFGTRVWSIEKDNTFQLVAAALLKMSQVTQRPFDHPFDKLDQRTLLRLDEESFYWERLKPGTVGKWDTPPNKNCKSFFLLEDLGTGARGHVWLACSSGGAVCVLKFLRGDPRGGPQKGDDKALEKELAWWQTVYPNLAKNVRLQRIGGRKALVMPHFDTPARDETTLGLVEQCLMKHFVERKLTHGDVRWRNVGVYKANGVMKAVVYDLEEVKESSEGPSWVRESILKLRERMG